MTENTPRQNMVRRIKALLAKTIENGATEAEAMSALAKAQEIMKAQGLSLEAIETEEFVTQAWARSQTRPFTWAEDIGYGVARFTGTYGFRENGSVNYSGRQSDVIFADWLTEALDAFITRQAIGYTTQVGGARVIGKKQEPTARGQFSLFGYADAPPERNPETPEARRRRMKDFGAGVAARISERLIKMGDAEAAKRQGLSLNFLKKQGWGFSDSTRAISASDWESFNAGRAAGDQASFNKPVGGVSGQTRMLTAA